MKKTLEVEPDRALFLSMVADRLISPTVVDLFSLTNRIM